MGDGNIATGSMPPPPVDCPRAEISPRRSLVGLLPLSRIYSLLIHARACACAWGSRMAIKLHCHYLYTARTCVFVAGKSCKLVGAPLFGPEVTGYFVGCRARTTVARFAS